MNYGEGGNGGGGETHLCHDSRSGPDGMSSTHNGDPGIAAALMPMTGVAPK